MLFVPQNWRIIWLFNKSGNILTRKYTNDEERIEKNYNSKKNARTMKIDSGIFFNLFSFILPLPQQLQPISLLYVPFSNRSRIAENAASVILISSIVWVAVGIMRNNINPLGITGYTTMEQKIP